MYYTIRLFVNGCFLVCQMTRGNQEKNDSVSRTKQLWLVLSPFLLFLVRADRVMCQGHPGTVLPLIIRDRPKTRHTAGP